MASPLASVATVEPEKLSTNESSVRVTILGVALFPNQSLAQNFTERNALNWTQVPPDQADLWVIFWDGQPGKTKQQIDQAMKDHRDVIAIKPDGTFTKIGFGCLLSK